VTWDSPDSISPGDLPLSNATNATKMEIWRATSETGTYSKVGEVGADGSVFVDDGSVKSLSDGTTYWYQVRAVNAKGYAASDAVQADGAFAASHIPTPWKVADLGTVGWGPLPAGLRLL